MIYSDTRKVYSHFNMRFALLILTPFVIEFVYLLYASLHMLGKGDKISTAQYRMQLED